MDTANPQYEGYDSTWPAGYEDRSTGILHVGARDYEPAVGRFLQPDPVEVGPESLAGLLNRWVYCADDPVNFSDPSGEFPWLIVIGAAILVGAIVGYFIDGARGAIIGALGAAAIMIAAWGFAEAVLGGGAAASGAITFGGGTAIKSLNDVVGRMAFDCNGVIGKVLDYMRLPGTGEIFLIIQTASDRIRHVPISVIRGFS
ncbi:MAG: RHS repeat-associated core domain-containing protein [Phycisphaerae bacterium]